MFTWFSSFISFNTFLWHKHYSVDIDKYYTFVICFNICMWAKFCFKSPWSMPSLTLYFLRETTLAIYMRVNVRVNNTCIYVDNIGRIIREHVFKLFIKLNSFIISWTCLVQAGSTKQINWMILSKNLPSLRSMITCWTSFLQTSTSGW